MMEDASVVLGIKNSYARMRRSAYGENFLIGLPGYFFDFHKLALQFVIGRFASSLPVLFKFTSSESMAVIPMSSYTTPMFDTVKIGDVKLGFGPNAYISVNGTAFNNSFQFDFSPIIMDSPSSSHPYVKFNTLMHRLMVQPGLMVLPAFYNANSSSIVDRVYGPILLTEAKITAAEGGGLGFNASFQGSTCISTSWDAGSSVIDALSNPSREAGLADVVILIGSEADEYFDENNLFKQSSFESDYNDPDAFAYSQLNVNNKLKRVVGWELNINNEYEFSRVMPSNNWTGYGSGQLINYYKSNDSAGMRYAVLTDRRVRGKITIVSDRIQDLDDDYLNDNYNPLIRNTRRLIISVAPGYHFPLTNVQFSIGSSTYTPDKSVRTEYSFVARVSQTIAMSLVGKIYQTPTSEFGYTYNINSNTLTGALE